MSEQRLAVVTGAAQGIGRAIVLELLNQGHKVAGLDLNAEQLTELEKVAAEAGHSVITHQVDITQTDKLTETLEQLAQEHGGIGILVNNAGITRDRLMMDYHEQFPQYNFKKHKGYPTKEHKALLVQFGPCEIHRKTFAGVKELVGSL